jgi:uncharacterized membrane protein YhhN
MTPLATVALVLAAGFALGDWIAKASENLRLEYVCKPATLALLIIVGVTLNPTSDARRAWFVAALIFSLAGDVLLMLPSDKFVAGLAAFLVAHLCYIGGFLSDGPAGVAIAISAIIVAALLAPLAVRIVRALQSEPELRGPVGAYILVIAMMLALALASGNALAAVGAVLFVASDAMIAWDRFVQPFPGAPMAIMVTYHLGQAGLVLSLIR